MAYRNQVYVCFDADTDMDYYRLMQAWKQNDNTAFDFNNAHDINTIRKTSTEATIKNKLRERMKNSKVLVVLVGANTKSLYQYVRWEIELAIEMKLPIVVVNLNKNRDFDQTRCPPILRDKLAIHIEYGQKVMQKALDDWPPLHTGLSANNDSSPKIFTKQVYDSLK